MENFRLEAMLEWLLEFPVMAPRPQMEQIFDIIPVTCNPQPVTKTNLSFGFQALGCGIELIYYEI